MLSSTMGFIWVTNRHKMTLKRSFWSFQLSEQPRMEKCFWHIWRNNSHFPHFVFIWITKWTHYTEHIMEQYKIYKNDTVTVFFLFVFVRQVTTVHFKRIQYCVSPLLFINLYLALDHKMLLKWNWGSKYLIASLKCAETQTTIVAVFPHFSGEEKKVTFISLWQLRRPTLLSDQQGQGMWKWLQMEAVKRYLKIKAGSAAVTTIVSPLICQLSVRYCVSYT